MNWKSVAMVAFGAALGTVGAHSYFNGFDLGLALIVGLAAVLGAVFMAFVAILGK